MPVVSRSARTRNVRAPYVSRWQGKRATAPTLLDPAVLNPELWLDAADASTITSSGGAVSQWTDKSTNARTFTQSTGTRKPTTGVTTQNGLNVIDFDGGDTINAGTAADWTFLHDGTKYVIAAVWKSSSGTQILLDTHAANVILSGASVWRLNTDTAVHMVGNSGGGTTYAVQHLLASVATTGTFHITAIEADPGNATAANRSNMRYDGGAFSSANTKTGTPDTAAPSYPLAIGGEADANGGLFLTGSVAEIIILRGADATPGNLDTLHAYLATKWGLTGPAGPGTLALENGLDGNSSITAWQRTKTSATSQSMLLISPPNRNSVDETTLVIYAHGNGGLYTDVYATSSPKRVAGSFISKNWVVASSAMHGNNWGSPTAVQDVVDLIAYARQYFNVTKIVTWGASMGNMALLNGYALDALDADVIGHVGSAPATDLLQWFNAGGASKADIKTAYGFTLDGDYATATSGYDPNLHTALEWTGKNLRMYVTSGDATTPTATNSAVLIAVADDTANDATVVDTGTGGHSDPTTYQSALIVAWLLSIGA